MNRKKAWKVQALEVGSSGSYEDEPGLDTWSTNTADLQP